MSAAASDAFILLYGPKFSLQRQYHKTQVFDVIIASPMTAILNPYIIAPFKLQELHSASVVFAQSKRAVSEQNDGDPHKCDLLSALSCKGYSL